MSSNDDTITTNTITTNTTNQTNQLIESVDELIMKILDFINCSDNANKLTEIKLLFNEYFEKFKDRFLHKINYTKCLILEDDYIFTEDIKNISNIIDNIPINWNMLFLGHTQFINSHNSKDINNPYFLQLLDGIPETHIYAVTQECAKILIEHTYPIRAAVDGYVCSIYDT